MSVKITPCINCKERPIVEEFSDPEFEETFLLRHKDTSVCHPSFKLESYNFSKEACIKDWNEFNTVEEFSKRNR